MRTFYHAIVHRAALRLHVVPLSVCDVGGSGQDHIGWKSCKLSARTISPSPSLFVAQRSSTYLQGTWGNLAETRGVGKNGKLEHKSDNISERRTDRGKVTMEGL